VPPLLPPIYAGEKRTTLCQLYEIEVHCYWEHLELRGTPWELDGNNKKPKKSHHPLPQKKRKNLDSIK
jgi:hypothetical protein